MTKTMMTVLMACAAIVVAVCSIAASSRPSAERVIKVTAKKFEFAPAEITVRRGEPITLEISSEDVRHGFTLPDFGIRADIKPGAPHRVSFTPDKKGVFTFSCDVFCGEGHEEMSGTLKVTD